MDNNLIYIYNNENCSIDDVIYRICNILIENEIKNQIEFIK